MHHGLRSMLRQPGGRQALYMTDNILCTRVCTCVDALSTMRKMNDSFYETTAAFIVTLGSRLGHAYLRYHDVLTFQALPLH